VRIVDVNLLIYATDDQSKHHIPAKRWLDEAMTATGTIGLPTAVTVAYVRLVTSPKVMLRPRSVGQATSIVMTWLGRPNVSVPAPTPRHYGVLAELLEATGVGGNLVSDAHLGALAVEHGAELWSYDADFSRFPGVRWRHPEPAA
jgi:toxin-antitoxin system PIN domain toxin